MYYQKFDNIFRRGRNGFKLFFLDSQFPVLSKFGKLAENYLYSDSNSCLMKLGMIGETIVNLMYCYDNIPVPEDNSQVAKIDYLYREGLLTNDLTSILHQLRKIRNKAAHDNYSSVSTEKSFCLLHIAFANGLCKHMVLMDIIIKTSLCYACKD